MSTYIRHDAGNAVSKAGFILTPPKNGRGTVTITCSRCGTVGSVVTPNAGAANSDQWTTKRFQALGWRVGSSRRKDVCGDCQTRPLEAREQPQPEPAPQPTPVAAPVAPSVVEKALDEMFAQKPTTPMEETMLNKASTTTTPKQKKPMVRASFGTRMKIHQLLEQHLTKNDDGTYTYAPGWNDQKIAEAVDKHLSSSNVRFHRLDQFGELRRTLLPRTTKAARLEALEKRITELEELVLSLTTK